MAATQAPSLHNRIETLIALARLLDRVEASPVAANADQYQALVRQVKAALAAPIPDAARESILRAHPAAAEIYENVHYDTSGLSRSPLDRSVETELLATRLIHKVARAASA